MCHNAAAWAACLECAQIDEQIPANVWDNFETAPLHDESDDMAVSFASEHDRTQEISEFSLLHNTVSTPEGMEEDITFSMDISTIEPNSVADLEALANSTALDAKIDALVSFFNKLITFDTIDTNNKLLQDVVPPMGIVAKSVAFITNLEPDPYFHPHEDPNANLISPCLFLLVNSVFMVKMTNPFCST
ncbi:hypothetical protein ACA910_000650 [Epithemia clementina (nom. ined.)]